MESLSDYGMLGAVIGFMLITYKFIEGMVDRARSKTTGSDGNGTKAEIHATAGEVRRANEFHQGIEVKANRMLDILTYPDADGRLRVYTPQGLEPAIKDLARATEGVTTFLRAHDQRTGIAIKKIDDIHDYIKDAGRKNVHQ